MARTRTPAPGPTTARAAGGRWRPERHRRHGGPAQRVRRRPPPAADPGLRPGPGRRGHRPAAGPPVGADARASARPSRSRSRPDPPTSPAPRCRGASTSPPPGRGGSWSSSPPGYVVSGLLGFFAVIALPIVVALLIAALVEPGRRRHATGSGCRAGSRPVLVVLAGLAIVAALLTFAGQQVANGANDLADQTVRGPRPDQATGCKTGPLHASDCQINDYIEQAQEAITDLARTSRASSAGSPRSAPRSGTWSRASSSCCSRPTSSSPTASGSGPGWCGSRRAPAGDRVDTSGPGRLGLADPVRPGHGHRGR